MNKGEKNMINSSAENVVDTGLGHQRCSALQGGLGVKPSASKNNLRATRGDFFGSLAPDSMLASPKIPYRKTKVTNVSINSKKGKQQQNKNINILNKKLLIPLIVIAATSCSTTNRKHKKINRVLKNQSQLIQSLQSERQSKKISAIVKGDDALAESERKLAAAIKALLRSNEVLQRAISKNGDK